MSKDALARFAERQEWLGELEEPLQNAIHHGFESLGPTGQPIRNALHGTWLGHPVHVVLTDVPVGAWTAAIIFDAIAMTGGGRKANYAADAAVAIGIVGALGAAATGLNDWAELDSKPRRIGLMHGLLNLGATALFAGSLVARKRRLRSAGRGLAMLGYVIATASAKLGGTLVYEERIGVDRSEEKELPAKFVAVLDETELEEGVAKRVEVDGTPIVLTKCSGKIVGLADTCSHLGGPLSEGKLEGCTIRCPWHGSRFSLETGAVLDGPAVHPQARAETRVRKDKIEVRKAQE